MLYIPEGNARYTSIDPFTNDRVEHEHDEHVQSFCIDRTEFRHLLYDDAVAEACGSRSVSECRTAAVLTCVSQKQAACYCERSRPGLVRRLPTDVEWMYAALGSDGRKFPWGNTPLPGGAQHPGEIANFCAYLPPRTPRYQRPTEPCMPEYAEGDRSPFGLIAMATSAGEWTSTCEEPLATGKQRCVIRAYPSDYVQYPDVFDLAHNVFAEHVAGGEAIGFRCAISWP